MFKCAGVYFADHHSRKATKKLTGKAWFSKNDFRTAEAEPFLNILRNRENPS